MPIRKNRNTVKELVDNGRLRQILEHGYLSSAEIQFVIDAVYDKLKPKRKTELSKQKALELGQICSDIAKAKRNKVTE